MIERVVENWLISANERQYQIPFCQLLASEGERIIYISPHGQMEQGKDVITIGRDRAARAYQLKQGNIALKDWRKYKGEIDELVLYSIEHPSVHVRKHHLPFLVTNGRVADPVLNAIRSANKAWSRTGGKRLRLIARDELVGRFVQAHGKFLPREPQHFARFLELLVNSGRGPFDKPKFAAFLESILPVRAKHSQAREVQRSICSAVLLTTYIVQGCERVNNHWGIFEAWTVMAAYIGAVVTKHSIAEKWWSISLDLCLMAARRSLEDLADECAGNKTKFTQGDPLTDGAFYGARITILSGLLSAASIGFRLRDETWNYTGFVQQFLATYLPKVKLWGESAVPYLTLAALEAEQHGDHLTSEGLILQLAVNIANVNGTKGRGIPNPYYEPEEAIRLNSGLDQTNAEVFSGQSYALEPLVQFLARRWLRRHLSSIWEKITNVHYASFVPNTTWEWFRWRCDDGHLLTTAPEMPQSWRALLQRSEDPAQGLPKLLDSKPELALYMTTVYPHRFTPDFLKCVEAQLRKCSGYAPQMMQRPPANDPTRGTPT